MASETVHQRFPDYGPCDIEDWKEFLTQEKTRVSACLNAKKFSHEERLDDLEQVTLLGSGSFGDVILVKHKKNGNYFAMKTVEKKKIIKKKQLVNLKNEKNVLGCIDFPLIVYLVFCFKDNSFIYMVMPFIPGGELYRHLTTFKKFGEAQAKFFASQVILALEYLHHLDIVYRDLKPENILVDQTGYLKVTDFGFCKRLTKPRTYTLCGTPEYMAPEVILNTGYGKSIDWWAIGVLIYEMVAGVSPFFAKIDVKIYEKIVAVKYTFPPSFSSELKDLLRNILQADVTRRFGNLKNGAEDIKGHQWFKLIDWMAILNRKVEAPWKPTYTSPGDVRNFGSVKWKQPVISKTNLYPKEFEDF